jgi:hypothetical protein
MEQVIQIEIDCGEKTCHSGDGKFCNFWATTDFNSTPVCLLFPGEREPFTRLTPAASWREVARCGHCLAYSARKAGASTTDRLKAGGL